MQWGANICVSFPESRSQTPVLRAAIFTFRWERPQALLCSRPTGSTEHSRDLYKEGKPVLRIPSINCFFTEDP